MSTDYSDGTADGSTDYSDYTDRDEEDSNQKAGELSSENQD
jgi:hypothetical protein